MYPSYHAPLSLSSSSLSPYNSFFHHFSHLFYHNNVIILLFCWIKIFIISLGCYLTWSSSWNNYFSFFAFIVLMFHDNKIYFKTFKLVYIFKKSKMFVIVYRVFIFFLFNCLKFNTYLCSKMWPFRCRLKSS